MATTLKTPIRFDGFRLRDADGEVVCSPSYWHEERFAETVRLANEAADLESGIEAMKEGAAIRIADLERERDEARELLALRAAVKPFAEAWDSGTTFVREADWQTLANLSPKGD